MADYYVDFSTGNDTTGDGSSGTPWKTIQKAVDTGTWATADGNALYVGNNAAEVLTTQITWSAGLLANDGRANPFIVRGWDNGGSLIITFPDGTTTTCGEIDGNDAVASLLSPLMQYAYLIDMKLHSTTSYVVDPFSWKMKRCYVYDSASTLSLIDGGILDMLDCYLYSDGTVASQDGIDMQAGYLGGNWIEGFDGNGVTTTGDKGRFVNNVVINGGDEACLKVAASSDFVINGNTFIGSGDANEEGIFGPAAGEDGTVITENIFAGFNGAGAIAVRWATASAMISLYSNNHYYDNSTDESFGTAPLVKEGNTVESSDPFTDSSTGDYSLVTGADSYQSGLSITSQNPRNCGADQTDNAAGGGGGETSHVFMA